MHRAHHGQPLVARRLAIAVQQSTHPVHEDLGAATGHAVETGPCEPVDHDRHRLLRQPRQVEQFRRRQSVQLEVWITRLDRAKEVLIPLERQVRVVTALQQQLHAPDRDGLVDFPKQLVKTEHVTVVGPDRAVEGAERALGDAHIRVVDIAIDDVRDQSGRVLPGPDSVRKTTE